MKRAIQALAICLLGVLARPARGAPIAWVEMTASGPEARAVTGRSECPALKIDGKRVAMTLRAPPRPDFPNRVCAAAMPPTARKVMLGKAVLPLFNPHPDRLVILGDSGCRLKGNYVQHCNDPSGWPFARVAALAAAQRPDLVIHVGDYYYRETPCPPGEAGCAHSPFGDRWATWKAEVYDPAAPLLAAAPWVFTRGNHEDCKRGGAGWFRLLDAAPEPKACPAESETMAVDLAGVKLYVLDSADGDDVTATPDLVAAFRARLDAMGPASPGERTWIITHRPVWYAKRTGETLADGKTNAIERAAARARDIGGVDLVIAGHVHNFTSLDFGSGRPAQLIVGTGGDVIDKNDSPPPLAASAIVDGMPAAIFTTGRWGYFVLDRQGDDWVGAFHDLTDAVIARCRIHARALTCAAV